MTEKKTESEPREGRDELALEKEKLRDLDVPTEDAEGVKGGINLDKFTETCSCYNSC